MTTDSSSRSGCSRAASPAGALAITLMTALWIAACATSPAPVTQPVPPAAAAVRPVVITQPVATDSDDPAIWINQEDPSQSLVLGTDKGGAVFVFDLDGRILPDRTVSGQGRVNNIDVEYGLTLAGVATDIAAATDRNANLIRVFRLPDMRPIDNGGIEAFAGEKPDLRRPMGIALYRRPTDGAVFAVVSRKTGPSGSYLWQYRLEDDGAGNVRGTKVRAFGAFAGTKEIEAVAVDDALGYIYYSEEDVGVHKYLADPDAPGADQELALFGTDGFTQDREGISIYPLDDRTGYILVSDQQANVFRVFRREGEPGAPHNHRFITTVQVSTNESDGSEVTGVALGDRFPAGLFVAMSDDRTFHFYSWADIAGDKLVKTPDGKPAAN